MQRFAFLASALLAAYQHSSADQTAYMRHLNLTVVAPTPDHRTYLAMDYDRPRSPSADGKRSPANSKDARCG